MQLERFDGFVREVLSDNSIARGCVQANIYRHFNGKWYDKSNELVSDEVLVRNLSAMLRRGPEWRYKGDVKAYFLIRELNLVIVVQFEKPAKKSTRLRYVEHFQRCLRNSKNAFDASHDSLTGLLNRGGFEARMLSVLNADVVAAANVPDASSKLQTSSIVGLIALDIDHFKQINDSHGHQYGDAVLQCFARRLDKVADSVIDESLQKLRLIIGRPGGEEFSVLVESADSVDQLLDIADRLRISVSEQALPSDQEWSDIITANETDLQLPPISERRVTVSLGVASSSVSFHSDTPRQQMNALIHCADTALYRAKVGGRNIVRSFSEILAKHGRILEHHESTGIVTIDIGSLVGVTIGQEFSVYHPDFCGGIPFLFRDGRTTKRLGDYPKVPSGRLVVFNVQNEIAFCRVAHRESSSNFLPGSVLEAIPIGSLSHLLAFDSHFTASAPDLISADKLPDAVKSIAQSGGKPFVAVFSVKAAAEVSNKKGQVFINQCLMKMHQTIREQFDFHTQLGQVQSSSVAIVCEAGAQSDDKIEKVKAVVEALNGSFHGQVTFIAGIFDPNDAEDEYGSKFDLSFGLDFARYAASEEEYNTVTNCQSFAGFVANNVVYASRKNRAYLAAIADYHKFIEHGVANPSLENQAALCEVERMEGDYDAALAAINRAIALKGDEPDYYANKAYIEYHRGNTGAILPSYRKCWNIKPDYALLDIYLASYALGLTHELLEKGGDNEMVTTAISTLDKATAFLTKNNRLTQLSELVRAKAAIRSDQRFGMFFPPQQ